LLNHYKTGIGTSGNKPADLCLFCKEIGSGIDQSLSSVTVDEIGACYKGESGLATRISSVFSQVPVQVATGACTQLAARGRVGYVVNEAALIWMRVCNLPQVALDKLAGHGIWTFPSEEG